MMPAKKLLKERRERNHAENAGLFSRENRCHHRGRQRHRPGRGADLCARGRKRRLADINEQGVEKTAEAVNTIGAQTLALTIDVTKRAAVEDMVQLALDGFGRIHFLFNSAGAALKRSKFLDIDDDLLERTLDLNLKGTFYAMQAVLPHMLKNKFGVIVNVGRMAHKRGGPGTSVHYAAAKGAVVTMTLGVAREFADAGHPRAVDLAGAGRHRLRRGGGDLAGTQAGDAQRRADETLRHAGGNRRTGAVHVFGRLRIHDRGHGLCERRRRLALRRE